MDISQLIAKVKVHFVPLAITFGWRLLGAIAVWVIGRFIIRVLRRGTQHAAQRRKMDPTLLRYLDSALNTALQFLLVIALLGIFGVETTAFAGLLAAAGVAIGMAWSGLLANFAAGLFMIFLRPFKVGDFVTVAGVTGDVEALGMFVTTIHSPDNIRVYVGNSKIFSDIIQNFSVNPYRRVELTAQLPHGVDPKDAIRRLKARLSTLPHVEKDPAPQVDVISFTLAGPVLAVRPCTHNKTYWDVYFATNLAIAEEFAVAGYPVPETHLAQRNIEPSSPAK
jgi:small conductance mechanosensitive channel